MNCFPVRLLSIIFFFMAAVDARTEVYQQVPAVIHMHSQLSGGREPLGALAAAASASGAGLAVVTDHDNGSVSYGFWPLRNLLKLTHEVSSVSSHGFRSYFEDIKTIGSLYNDLVFLPGVESRPYYRWEFDFKGARLLDLHKHFIVFGLDSPEKFANLPSLHTGYTKKYTIASLAQLFWILPFLLGAIMMKSRMTQRQYQLGKKSFKIPSIIMIISGIFIANGYPFSEREFTQYSLSPGAGPYQRVIDYVDSHGGLIFWAHPEAGYREEYEISNRFLRKLLNLTSREGFKVFTAPYTHLLAETENYTGFAIFFEGAKIVGSPGGLWDALLLQYCAGRRDRPVWAVSELDLKGAADKNSVSDAQTILLVRDRTVEEYLEAIRNGRMYCFANYFSRYWKIKEYSIISGGNTAVSGEKVTYIPGAVLNMEFEKLSGNYPLDVKIIMDGEIVYNLIVNQSGKYIVPLGVSHSKNSYVRMVAYNDRVMRIATNPIFLER